MDILRHVTGALSVNREHLNALTVSIFLVLLLLVTTLTIQTKIGLIVFAAAALLMTALLRPDVIYLVMIGLFSIEGFSALESVSYPKILGVLLVVGLALRLALTREAMPKDDTYKYFVFFFAGSSLSFIVAKDLFLSIKIFIVYISLLFLYVFTRHFLRSLGDVHKALNFIFFSTVLVFAVVQVTGLTVKGPSARVSSGLADPNEFASYILVLLCLVFYRTMYSSGVAKVLFWSCLVTFFVMLVLSGSRGGILGFLGASMVLIYYYAIGKMKQIILLTLSVLIIAFFFVPDKFWERVQTITNPEAEQGSSIATRLDNYKAALRMFVDYPVLGVGLYNFKLKSKDYGASGNKVVHNTYLEILTGGGILSFIPFIAILVSSWRKLRLRQRYDTQWRDFLICLKAAFASLLITSFFISADHKKILWFLLALISSVYYLASARSRTGASEDMP